MHIVDGAVSLPVLVGGGLLAVGGVAIGLRRLSAERIPQVGLLSAAFFVASLIHVPIGLSSTHLVLNGLLGVVLGWAAFPALLIALLLQAVLFGFGGILVLGLNTLNLAVPAVLCFYLCGPGIRNSSPQTAFAWGVLAGALAIALSALAVAASLAFSGDAFIAAAWLVLISNIPVLVVEGLLTGATVVMVRKIKPELFSVPARAWV
ncbi:MAG: cobalt transporter CbiM [Candidatus Competibacteraceae bacterium]|jgi:cobalt/nickel transport system permease protein|nr:cobalt transporter CbiM [Candidatus Competibacteraceae bacterium]